MTDIHLLADTEGLSAIIARSSSGSGNNQNGRGAAGENYLRVTPHSYGSNDGSVWDPGVEAGGLLPNARAISNAIMDQDDDRPSSYGINEYHQFFGQFFTHDIAQAQGGTAEGVSVEGLPANPFAPPGTPNFTRDAFELDGAGVRQHVNLQTSFLDLSQVYGQSQTKTTLLRDPGSGRLIMGDDDLLPTVGDIDAVHGAGAATGIGAPGLFQAGDSRVNQQAPLISHHTVWARNHNHHADKLDDKHPEWSNEQVFQAARALNEAEWQQVVYSEYAAKIVGPSAIKAYKGYKASVDPSITNEYTTVANRFGHDQSSENLLMQNETGATFLLTTLSEIFLDPSLIDTRTELDQWVRGQMSRTSQEIDGKVADGNRNALFGGFGGVFDLEVLDIMRGRDHGVANYNVLRKGVGLKAVKSFEEFGSKNALSADTVAALKTLYGDDISKLDSIIGGLLEKDARGSILGETMTRVTVAQFEAMRDGDRFFHLNRFKGDKDLLDAIKETSLADIVARNTDIDYVYHDAFAAHQRLSGDDGKNTINGTAKADLVMALGGDDTIRAGKRSDDAYGGEGKDDVYGGDGHDFVFGDGGADKVRGEEGNDHVHGGAGDDEVWGGSGRDWFHFEQDAGKDKIRDFRANEDTIDLSEVDGFANFNAVKAAMTRSGAHTKLAFSADDYVLIENTKINQFKSSHFDYTDEYFFV